MGKASRQRLTAFVPAIAAIVVPIARNTGSPATSTATAKDPRAKELRGARGSSQRLLLSAQNSETASTAGSAPTPPALTFVLVVLLVAAAARFVVPR